MILGMADYPSYEGPLEDFLNFAFKLGVRVVELKLDRLELFSTLSKTDKVPSIKNLLNSYDFKYFVHAPSIDTNLASLNPALRRASEKTILKAVNFAAKIEAELLVSHVGRLSRDYPRKLVEKSMKNATSSLNTLVHASSDLGVIFTIENDHSSRDHILVGYPKQIKFLIESSGCKLTFDVGHANTVGKIVDFTKLFDKFIVNVHLSDNNGREDEHLPIGKGSIDFVGMFKKMKDWWSQKTLIIECHSFAGLKKSIDFVRQEFVFLSKDKKVTLK